jgi:hypothetical protein
MAPADQLQVSTKADLWSITPNRSSAAPELTAAKLFPKQRAFPLVPPSSRLYCKIDTSMNSKKKERKEKTDTGN